MILPDATILLDYMLVRMTGLIDGSWSAPSGCARTSSAASGSTRAAASSSRSSRKAGMSREDAYAIVQRASLRAADERAPLRDLLAVDPAVAGRLSLASLDACFDDAAFLRHVPEVDRAPGRARRRARGRTAPTRRRRPMLR